MVDAFQQRYYMIGEKRIDVMYRTMEFLQETFEKAGLEDVTFITKKFPQQPHRSEGSEQYFMQGVKKL